mmetsp:Transcript_36569/g.32789  ORF Transcript_36569/g.32789 Transcript_36569/m.32789 type:complete len:127 (+) Transcript_36569:39-419(+)
MIFNQARPERIRPIPSTTRSIHLDNPALSTCSEIYHPSFTDFKLSQQEFQNFFTHEEFSKNRNIGFKILSVYVLGALAFLLIQYLFFFIEFEDPRLKEKLTYVMIVVWLASLIIYSKKEYDDAKRA